MSNKTQQNADSACRAPDCVTELRVGNTLLTVRGYFKQSATETAHDKMAKVIETEGVLRDMLQAAG